MKWIIWYPCYYFKTNQLQFVRFLPIVCKIQAVRTGFFFFFQEPRDVCDKLPDLSKYQPRYFTTTALQQVKVELTWDETNPVRSEISQKLMSGQVDGITETDLRDYLASSSGEESDGNT